MKRLIIAAAILSQALVFSSLVMGEEQLDCTRCHQNPAMTPSLKNSVGVPRSLYIDPKAFEQSWHYKIGKKTQCVLCHEKIKSFPHERSEPLKCSNCHPDDKKPEFREIEENLSLSVHSKLECIDCHDVHRNKPANEMTLEEKNAGCLKCHQYGLQPGAQAGIEPISIRKYHSWHPQAELHMDRMACIVCHTTVVSEGEADKHLILDKSKATRQCSVCHSGNSKISNYLIDVGPKPKGDAGRNQLLERIYLVGGTRNRLVETMGTFLLAFTVLGVIGHGAGRVFMSRRRSK